jgi:hypothetical protein
MSQNTLQQALPRYSVSQIMLSNLELTIYRQGKYTELGNKKLCIRSNVWYMASLDVVVD